MKSRFTALALVSLMALAACEDATTPDPGAIELGRPNIAITNPLDNYGFVDSFATFLKPLVADPFVDGETLNQNLQPIIEIWVKGVPNELGEYSESQVLLEPSGDHACVGNPIDPNNPEGLLYEPIATFTPQVNFDETYYEYGWKTDREPQGGLAEDVVHRICVKILRVVPGGDAVRQLVLWRDVIPAQTNNPNNPEGNPYEFQNGSNIPIKFWISSKSLCFDEDGNVIDCTIATFGFDGGTATCDAAQCGISVPGGGTAILNEGDFATFEVRYVNCGVTDPDGTIDYLPIDIPQYPGCLTVTVTANFPWSSFDELGPGLVAAACRDVTVLGEERDERLLLHIESADATEYYALPTRQFDLECGPQPLAQAPGPSGTVGDWMRYYATRGIDALTQPVRSLFAPRELTAAHAGFGGGTSLGCNGASTEGPDGVIGCSSPSLAAAAGETTADVQPGEPVEFRMVWALPSKISERLEWLADGDPPDTRPWIDPVSGTAGGPALNPAVLVTDECEIQLGGTPEEDCVGQEEDQPVSGARVTFTFFGEDGTTVLGTAEDITDVYGIAKAEWTLPGAGLWEATAGGLGIGVDAGLIDDNTGVAGGGAYQEHIGNEAVLLETGAVRFRASACSDKSDVLKTAGVEMSVYGEPYPVPINVSGSDVEEAFLYVTTDCNNAYFALEVPASEDLQNSLRVVFMDQLENLQTTWDPSVPTAWFSDVPDLADDMWFISRDNNKKSPTYLEWQIEDWHVSDDCTGSSKQSECGRSDPVQNLLSGEDLFGDLGIGPVETVGGATVYEFARCFPGPDNPDCVVDGDGYDFYVPGVGQSTWIGFYLVLQQGKGAQGNTEYPDFRVFQPIEIVRQ